jgi:hypothetical protein
MTKEEFGEICLEYVRAERLKGDADALAAMARVTYQDALNRLSLAIIENPDLVDHR